MLYIMTFSIFSPRILSIFDRFGKNMSPVPGSFQTHCITCVGLLNVWQSFNSRELVKFNVRKSTVQNKTYDIFFWCARFEVMFSTSESFLLLHFSTSQPLKIQFLISILLALPLRASLKYPINASTEQDEGRKYRYEQ